MNITIAQALLLIIEYHQINKEAILADEDAGEEYYNKIYNELISLYINGPLNPDQKIRLYDILDNFNDPVLLKYTYPKLGDEVDFHAINNDPTKRYFETHLAFQSIRLGMDAINIYLLKKYKSLMENVFEIDKAGYEESICLLDGRIPQVINKDTDRQNYLFYHEYADYISRIKNNEIFTDEQGFSADKREKILLIVQCSILAVLCATSDVVKSFLPLDIYGSGPFKSEKRGKLIKGLKPKDPDEAEDPENPVDHTKASSHHHGLMKSYMPLLSGDEAMSSKPYGYLKPSDQASFDPSAGWPVFNFSRLVHPFSNSVSGTALCQLRMLALFQKKPEFEVYSFTENENEFKNFYRTYASILLFFSGGHSFMEFVMPLQLSNVISEFSSTEKGDYLNLSEASILNLFIPGDDKPYHKKIKRALDIALEKAIEYNHLYLEQQFLNQEVESFNKAGLKKVQTRVSYEPEVFGEAEKEDKMEVDDTFSPADSSDNEKEAGMTSSSFSSEDKDVVQELKKRKREDEDDAEAVKKAKVETLFGASTKKKYLDKKDSDKNDSDPHKKYKK